MLITTINVDDEKNFNHLTNDENGVEGYMLSSGKGGLKLPPTFQFCLIIKVECKIFLMFLYFSNNLVNEFAYLLCALRHYCKLNVFQEPLNFLEKEIKFFYLWLCK